MSPDAEKDRKDIASGARANFFGFLVRLGSRLPFLLFAAGLYGTGLFGRFVLTITLIEILALFCTFGLKRSLFKVIHEMCAEGKYSAEQVIATALLLTLLVSTGCYFLLVQYAETIAGLLNYPQIVAPLLTLAPMILVVVALDVLLAATRSTRLMRYEVIARSIVEPYALLASAVLFYYLDYREMGLFMAFAISHSTALLFAIWGVFQVHDFRNFMKTRLHFRLMRNIATFTAPTAFHDTALLLFMRMDQLVVKFFFSEAVLGIYAIAHHITTIVEKIHQGFYPILAPVMSKNMADKNYGQIEHQMVMVSRWILMIQCVLVLLSYFYGQLLFDAIASSDTPQEILALGGGILMFLVIGETINGGFGTADLPLIYRKPILNPILTLAMIPLYLFFAYYFTQILLLGPMGIAIALCTTYFIMNLLRVMLIRWLFGINMLRLRLFTVILAAFVTAAAFHGITVLLPVDILHGFGILMGAPMVITLYILTLVIIGLEKEDKKKLRAKFSFM